MSENPFNKVEREKPLSHKVEEQIREAISKKLFLPGDKLPGEMQLAEKFGVSRTAIREALRMLSGRGMVKIHKGSGVYVSELCISTVVDPFYQFLDMKCGDASLLHIARIRLFMEPPIAKLASQYCQKEDLKFWKKNLKEMEQYLDDSEKAVEIDIEFHRRIASATRNPIIPIMMEPIYQLLHKFISSTYKQNHAMDLAIENHTNLLKYFEGRDADLASSTMKIHMRQAENHVLQYYESMGMSIN